MMFAEVEENYMPRDKLNFSDVRRIARALTEVQETTIHGAPALKLRGKLLTCRAIHKSAEPNSLAVRVGFKERERLVESEPETYYLTDHYVNYPVVLARLSHMTRDSLKGLLELGCGFVNSKVTKGVRVTGKATRALPSVRGRKTKA